jgi:hypothetical protein
MILFTLDYFIFFIIRFDYLNNTFIIIFVAVTSTNNYLDLNIFIKLWFLYLFIINLY